jgi:hypothetical protein
VAIQNDTLFTVFGRYDDTAAAGEEQAKFVDGVKTTQANNNDLVAGGDTRVGVDHDGVGDAADGLIGPVFVFALALTDSEVLAFSESSASATEAQEGRFGRRWGRWRQLVR